MDTLVDENDGVGTGDISLRDAIAEADTGETIYFAPTLFGSGPGTIELDYGALDINDDVIIEGPGADLLTVDAQEESTDVFSVASGVTATIRGLTITGGDGGAAYGTIDSQAASLTLDYLVITENTGYGAGGVYQSGGDLVITNTAIAFNNTGQYLSGGVYVTGADLLIENSTIADNFTANHGGGIHLDSSTAVIRNSTISGNAANNGGGIFATESTLLIENSTIADNYSTSDGGGIYADDSDVTIHHTIIAGNTNEGGTDDAYGDFNEDSSYNLIGHIAGSTGLDDWSTSIFGYSYPIDAKLAPLGDYGGPTPTHALLHDSPAIDAGDPDAVAGEDGVPLFDQRGDDFGRVVDGDLAAGARIDIGAFEYAPDLIALSFDTSGYDFRVTYTVFGQDVDENDGIYIDVYRSPSPFFPDLGNQDALLMTDHVTTASKLAVGSHTVTFDVDFSTLGNDVDEDYYLVAFLSSPDPAFAGESVRNSLADFAGGTFVDTGSSNWHIHGDDDDDTFNFSSASGPTYVRTHGGDDVVTLNGAITYPFHVFGGDGDDDITTAAGDDLLSGGAGVDLLDGGDGDDTYQITAANDSDVTIDDADGEDTLDFSRWNGISGVAVDLAFAADEWQTLHGWHNVRLQFADDEALEDVVGSPLGDSITGNSLANILWGGDGGDQLYGGAGDDDLYGEDGNDYLDGGAGYDTMSGGTGHDSYSSDDTDNDDHAPVLEDIPDVSVRHYQGFAFRILADDAEDDYGSLTFSIEQTGGDDVTGFYSLSGGVFRWNAAGEFFGLLDPGQFTFEITVSDTTSPTPLTDSDTFTVTMAGYNLEPPDLEPEYPAPTDWTWWGWSLNEEPQSADPAHEFVGSDSQTAAGNYEFGGVLDEDGVLHVDWDNYPKTSAREVVEVTDDGTDGSNVRSRQRAIYIAQVDLDDTGQYVVLTFPGVARDDHTWVDVNDTEGVFVDLKDNDHYNETQYGDEEDPDFAPTIYYEPTATYGTITDFDATDGTFTYIPNEDFEGLDVFTYTFQNPTVWEYGPFGRGHIPDEVGYIDSNEAFVYIEVGKAVRAKLKVADVENPEDDEGWHIMLNDDDDNGNEQSDLTELVGPIEHEDDLEQLEVGYWLREDAYADDYLAYFYTESPNIRLWTTSDKQEEIIPFGEYTTGREFTLAELPGEIWVEGIARGTASLSLNIYGPSSSLFTDMVHPPGSPLADTLDGDHVGGGIHGGPGFTAVITSMQVGVGLTAYRPMSGPGKYEPFGRISVENDDEGKEDLGPGIRINRDDDNNNGTKDLSEAGVQNENDLIEVRIDRLQGQDDLILQRLNGYINVWEDLAKTTEIEFNEGTQRTSTLNFGGELTKTVYVEWFGEVHGNDLLELKSAAELNVAIDTINFHSFEGIVVGLSGLTDEGRAPTESGMFGLATEVYKKGFDVYYFDQKEVASGPYDPTTPTGTGAAFSAIIAAVQGKLTATGFDRMVTHVGIFGHSYGGGATYDLAWRTNVTYPTVEIDYTAYVDAIQRTGVRPPPQFRPAETHRPPASKFHDNYYQISSRPHGADTDKGTGQLGNNIQLERDREEWEQPGPPAGQKHTHTTIDDEKKLWAEIVTHISQLMDR